MDSLPFIVQIFLAILLGSAAGWQREQIGKAAGMRTFALVCMGSALFTTLSLYGFGGSANGTDPSRVASQILTGIGFIGAGSILHKGGGVEGLTTAAGLWAIAAVGMLIGVGWLLQACIATFGIILIFYANRKFFKR